MATNIEYVNGLVQEGAIGNMRVYCEIQSMKLDCPSCGHVLSRDVWDGSPSGHEACGMVSVRINCWDCGSNTTMYIHEGCIVCMETDNPVPLTIPHGSSFDAQTDENLSGPFVGSWQHRDPVGKYWNVAENRPMTWEEKHPTYTGIMGDDGDEIPF